MNAPFNVVTLNTPPVHACPPGMDIERLDVLIREPRHSCGSHLPRVGLLQLLSRTRLQADIARGRAAIELGRHRAALDISREDLRMEE